MLKFENLFREPIVRQPRVVVDATNIAPNEFPQLVGIRPIKIIYQDPATIVFYKNHRGVDRKVVAKCSYEDLYDRSIGLRVALLKALKKEAQKELATI